MADITNNLKWCNHTINTEIEIIKKVITNRKFKNKIKKKIYNVRLLI